MKIQPLSNNSFGWEISTSLKRKGEVLTKSTIYKRDNGLELYRLDTYRNDRIISTVREMYNKFKLLRKQVFLYDFDGKKQALEWFM